MITLMQSPQTCHLIAFRSNLGHEHRLNPDTFQSTSHGTVSNCDLALSHSGKLHPSWARTEFAAVFQQLLIYLSNAQPAHAHTAATLRFALGLWLEAVALSWCICSLGWKTATWRLETSQQLSTGMDFPHVKPQSHGRPGCVWHRGMMDILVKTTFRAPLLPWWVLVTPWRAT